MRKNGNIKAYKTELRAVIKGQREKIVGDERKEAEAKIINNIYALDAYKKADTILCFVSLPGEVETRSLINSALKNGKKVAVPRCISGTRQMEFYYINSLDELVKGSFDVYEPVANPERLYIEGKSSDLMVVPCLSFDSDGYRLGYGGGYYDRYLDNFVGRTVVVTFHKLLLNEFWHGKYDLPCDITVTDKSVKYIGAKGVN